MLSATSLLFHANAVWSDKLYSWWRVCSITTASFVSARVSPDYLITSSFFFEDPSSHRRTPAGLLIVFWVVGSTTGREMSLPRWLTVAGRSSTVCSGVKVWRVSPRRQLFLTLHLCLTLITLCSPSLIISPRSFSSVFNFLCTFYWWFIDLIPPFIFF